MRAVISLLLIFCGLINAEAGKKLTVLIKMIPAQEKFFNEVIINQFNEKHGCTVEAVTFGDNWELITHLKKKGPVIDVVKTPMGISHTLAASNLVKPINDVLGKKELQQLRDQYFLMNLAEFGGKLYYLPRKFETRIMVYLKSKVREAVKNWESVRKGLEEELKAAIGKGLPEKYTLEPDPSQWDYYDILTAGFYWADTSSGGRAGRIAHRGKDYSGTALGLMDRCFQMGASSDDITNTASTYYTQALLWESLYSALGVYNPKSWEQGWDGRDLWKAFQNGEVFLSYLTQIDCYALHGSSGEFYLPDTGDFGVSIMPEAVFLDQSMSVKRSISTGGWLWGIGQGSQNPRMALELIQHITSFENQVEDIERFGMIPVSKEILGRSNVRFKEDWKNRVFAASLQQLRLNGKTSLPQFKNFEKLEKSYITIWKRVVTASKDGYLGELKVKARQFKK